MNPIEQAKQAGFSEVETFGGWVPLDEWRPYGKQPSDTGVAMRLDVDRKAFREEQREGYKYLVPFDCCVLGVWPVR